MLWPRLVVADIREAREALVKWGLEVSEVWDLKGVKYVGDQLPQWQLVAPSSSYGQAGFPLLQRRVRLASGYSGTILQ